MLSSVAVELLAKFIEKKNKVLADMRIGAEAREEAAGILSWAVTQLKRAARKSTSDSRPFTVYLSGSIDGLDYAEATESRNRVTKMLEAEGIAVRDPMRGKENLKDCKRINSAEMMRLQSRTYTSQEITARDLHDLEMSDAILVLTGDKLSWGTQGEFWWCAWLGHKPRCVLCETPKYRDSLWLKHYATRIVKSEEEAVETLAIWANHWDPV